MNFNVYLDDALVDRLDALAKRSSTPRNALVRKAVEHWVQHEGEVWPPIVLAWTGDRAVVPFESFRAELGEARDAPFESLPGRSPTVAPRTRRRQAAQR